MRSLLYIVLAAAADVLYDCDKQTNGSYPYPTEKCLEVFCDIVIDTNDKLNLSDSTVFDMVYRDMLSLDYFLAFDQTFKRDKQHELKTTASVSGSCDKFKLPCTAKGEIQQQIIERKLPIHRIFLNYGVDLMGVPPEIMIKMQNFFISLYKNDSEELCKENKIKMEEHARFLNRTGLKRWLHWIPFVIAMSILFANSLCLGWSHRLMRKLKRRCKRKQKSQAQLLFERIFKNGKAIFKAAWARTPIFFREFFEDNLRERTPSTSSAPPETEITNTGRLLERL